MSEEQINPAGVFLRTLREGGRPGAQAEGGSRLPVKEALLALRQGEQGRQALAERLGVSRSVVDETLRNLASLDLIRSSGLGEGEKVSLTDVGRELAERS